MSIQLLAPYLVWRSRWNIPAHLAIGFCITAYVIPGLLTDVWSGYADETVTTFILINLLGGLSLCAGVLFAKHARRTFGPMYVTNYFNRDLGYSIITKRIVIVFSICVAGIYLAYAIMGFMPIFADDPYSARQFKGMYRDMYYKAAYLYRFSFSIIHMTMPVLLLLAWYKRSKYLVVIATLAVLSLIASLSRGPMAAGMLLFLGVLAAQQRAGMRWYIPLVAIIFPFGSVFFFWLGSAFELQGMTDAYAGESFSEFVSAGAPDINDQLRWLHGFLNGEYYSYGRTIIGGLIPGNYQWNPSIWTLTFDDVGADTSELVTGGLRLTNAEWGFANFGWLGVVIMPFLSGVINGFILLYMKHATKWMRPVQIGTALVVYNTLGLQMVQYYFLSIHSIPAIAAALFFWNANSRRAKYYSPVLSMASTKIQKVD
ncbi:hypothetical protein NYR55_07940 [Sphingomonas sp. BGYR3]|uniref:hypothetical protein n=1 Tax=Sphingomonas sp. BGYR3 TaxID=2975483 RepID=UPI0021A4162D|nr:hypothetical protein [Sphingomonas sp. BGYR3]MDG5488543.1 hypothetical protein [Sphingomonas sp. BGYR3]